MTNQHTRFAKSIKIFLIDGDPNGRMSCELSQWTGKAYKIPRILVSKCTDREDLKKSGVYMLFGKTDQEENLVYIGESENVFFRLKEHLSGDKDFWSECVTFISKDENLNKAHIKYLEYRLYHLAKKSSRYALNQNIPAYISISESEQAEMEEFTENLRIIVNTLGHKVFEELPSMIEASRSQSLFFYRGPRNSEAKGVPTNEGFLVFKGSKASSETTESLAKGYKLLRQDLIAKGVLKMIGPNLEFTEDYIFSSSTAALTVIAGSPGSGPALWKNEKNYSLRNIEEGK